MYRTTLVLPTTTSLQDKGPLLWLVCVCSSFSGIEQRDTRGWPGVCALGWEDALCRVGTYVYGHLRMDFSKIADARNSEHMIYLQRCRI